MGDPVHLRTSLLKEHFKISDWLQIVILLIGFISIYFRMEKRMSMVEYRMDRAELHDGHQDALLSGIARCCER